MNELISRAALLKYFSLSPDGVRYKLKDCDGFLIDVHLEEVQKAIRAVPTIGAAHHRRSEWITNSDRPDTLICKHCDTGFDMWKHESEYFHHCPSCGARMDGESNG